MGNGVRQALRGEYFAENLECVMCDVRCVMCDV